MKESFFIEDKIFWFEISMEDSVVVKEKQGHHDARRKELYDDKKITCLFFVEFSIFYEMKAKISSRYKVHQQVEILPVLECK